MDKSTILNSLAQIAIDTAKENALEVLVSLGKDQLQPIVEERLNELIIPLEEEIEKTSSIWVKIRNRLYVKLIKAQVTTITEAIIEGIQTLQESQTSESAE